MLTRRYWSKLLIVFLFVSPTICSQTLAEADSLYHHYEFDKAIEIYDKLTTKLNKAKKFEEVEAMAPLIEKNEKAARMLAHCEDIQIIDSLILDKEQFLEAYKISSEAGYLIEEGNRLYYVNQLMTKRYFAEENKEDLARLYSETKLQREWTDRSELKLAYDPDADYGYPFVLSDGVTLYFASTGHGSLGGYDLFISRYDYGGNAYFTPSQLGMPFNSPANDYMLAIDEINNIGYFATDRYQPEDKVVVYTYIPNQSVIPIGGDDKNYLTSRAKITSIADSWKEGADYQAYMQKVADYIRSEQKQNKRDFTFVINDNIIYHTLEDFDIPAARQSFRQLQDLNTQIEAKEAELDSLRKQYIRSATTELTGRILHLEQQLQAWEQQRLRLETDTRNLEIRGLRNNQ